jgi:hypothetical protein
MRLYTLRYREALRSHPKSRDIASRIISSHASVSRNWSVARIAARMKSADV